MVQPLQQTMSTQALTSEIETSVEGRFCQFRQPAEDKKHNTLRATSFPRLLFTSAAHTSSAQDEHLIRFCHQKVSSSTMQHTLPCECKVGKVPKVPCLCQADLFVVALVKKPNHLVRNLCRHLTRMGILESGWL